METQSNITPLMRKEKMFMWMRVNGFTYAEIAERIGVTAQGVSKMFMRSTIPTRRYQQLVEVGVPVEILPPPKDIPSGPKPRPIASY